MIPEMIDKIKGWEERTRWDWDEIEKFCEMVPLLLVLWVGQVWLSTLFPIVVPIAKTIVYCLASFVAFFFLQDPQFFPRPSWKQCLLSACFAQTVVGFYCQGSSAILHLLKLPSDPLGVL
jgi:hypothetical protein